MIVETPWDWRWTKDEAEYRAWIDAGARPVLSCDQCAADCRNARCEENWNMPACDAFKPRTEVEVSEQTTRKELR
jgi:hypothetical protein